MSIYCLYITGYMFGLLLSGKGSQSCLERGRGLGLLAAHPYLSDSKCVLPPPPPPPPHPPRDLFTDIMECLLVNLIYCFHVGEKKKKKRKTKLLSPEKRGEIAQRSFYLILRNLHFLYGSTPSSSEASRNRRKSHDIVRPRIICKISAARAAILLNKEKDQSLCIFFFFFFKFERKSLSILEAYRISGKSIRSK